ncbi:hypothetical protein GUJ93_ZPchr0007g4810 [Zizania palustris]|uniref:Uncharacterized protein n=1 Tax=Zizania palustris TaxID=103762 RepID=A0A8J5T7H8_ZIZPA|nr:hypothetical protein GUJ93_ZPchr0007g4810 [Zizania palustris]
MHLHYYQNTIINHCTFTFLTNHGRVDITPQWKQSYIRNENLVIQIGLTLQCDSRPGVGSGAAADGHRGRERGKDAMVAESPRPTPVAREGRGGRAKRRTRPRSERHASNRTGKQTTA